MFRVWVLYSKMCQVTCLQSPERVVCFQTDFPDVNCDKATNMCKNVLWNLKSPLK